MATSPGGDSGTTSPKGIWGTTFPGGDSGEARRRRPDTVAPPGEEGSPGSDLRRDSEPFHSNGFKTLEFLWAPDLSAVILQILIISDVNCFALLDDVNRFLDDLNPAFKTKIAGIKTQAVKGGRAQTRSVIRMEEKDFAELDAKRNTDPLFDAAKLQNLVTNSEILDHFIT
ncbi:hypothetical protein KSP39_PZI006651 [Platanthera zijinensis]|uniref:Uncharacterized protein n=1 Tax=Platanthera zijinensis TaxID=2320716 RepID=A0AAP0BRI6_9ASPA